MWNALNLILFNPLYCQYFFILVSKERSLSRDWRRSAIIVIRKHKTNKYSIKNPLEHPSRPPPLPWYLKWYYRLFLVFCQSHPRVCHRYSCWQTVPAAGLFIPAALTLIKPSPFSDSQGDSDFLIPFPINERRKIRCLANGVILWIHRGSWYSGWYVGVFIYLGHSAELLEDALNDFFPEI